MLATAAVKKKGLPPPGMILAPGYLVAQWESPTRAHPNLAKLNKQANEIIGAFARIAKFSFDHIGFTNPDKPDPVAIERLRRIMDALRAMLPLLDGASMAVFERDVARHCAFVAPRFFQLKAEAESKMRALLGLLSFLLEDGPESDAEDFVPAPRPSVKSGKSVSLKL